MSRQNNKLKIYESIFFEGPYLYKYDFIQEDTL